VQVELRRKAGYQPDHGDVAMLLGFQVLELRTERDLHRHLSQHLLSAVQGYAAVDGGQGALLSFGVQYSFLHLC